MLDELQQQYNIDNKVHVYVAEFDDSVEVQDVKPPIRNDAIAATTDPLLKRQRYCVWRLLDYALRQLIGKGVDGLNFTRDANGKWSAGGVYFSLSHSRHAVAVAVCLTESVGVDIEYVAQDRFNARLAERVLTDDEQRARRIFSDLFKVYHFVSCWTKKEAIFKRDGGAAFLPSAINTYKAPIYSLRLELNSGIYWLSAATVSNLPTKLRIISPPNL
ncbi:MAG: 4'-phosphopantetheinyl transferase superfamily protein [Clostridiales bacterium]|nr:4'-phosphopantetheinyl transferase superfamily protein [Clostridiales bacterium]